MTPAERLRAAADTIERTANAATPGPWGENTGRPNRYGAIISHDAPCDDDEREGYGGALIGESMLTGNRAHVALWDPPTALLAAEILRTMADRVEQLAPVHVGNPDAALAFADRILTGGAS
jgi:hypothetical protein